MKLVCGVGENDADYVVQPTVDGKQVWCPYYSAWLHMLRRCYYIPHQQRNPTYVGCEVDPRWHKFMTFRSWMETQDWQDKQLDKDFLGDGKLYSPETCHFIPGWLNKLFIDCGAARGELPLGVSKTTCGFRAYCKVRSKFTHIGYFDSPTEAFAAYVEFKTNHVRCLYPDIKAIDPRLVNACELKLQDLRNQYDNYRYQISC